MTKKKSSVSATAKAGNGRATPQPAAHLGDVPLPPAGDPGPVSNVCVYCGSGPGAKPVYAEAARTLGKSLAANSIGLVYGGGGLGLMGEVARSTLANGGRVTGIIPKFLTEKEHMLTDVTEIIVTEDMHVRKRLMFERSDAFVALPGGIGTLDEIVTMWSQMQTACMPIRPLILIGAGWQRIGQTSGKEYISLSISAPEFGKTLYANLGRAAGQSDPNAYALIWTPQD